MQDLYLKKNLNRVKKVEVTYTSSSTFASWHQLLKLVPVLPNAMYIVNSTVLNPLEYQSVGYVHFQACTIQADREIRGRTIVN